MLQGTPGTTAGCVTRTRGPHTYHLPPLSSRTPALVGDMLTHSAAQSRFLMSLLPLLSSKEMCHQVLPSLPTLLTALGGGLRLCIRLGPK